MIGNNYEEDLVILLDALKDTTLPQGVINNAPWFEGFFGYTS